MLENISLEVAVGKMKVKSRLPDVKPYKERLRPEYRTESLGNVYLMQRAEGGIFNRMIVVSDRDLKGENNISMINFDDKDPEFLDILRGLKSSTLYAMKHDFFPRMRYKKIEVEELRKRLEGMGFDEEMMAQVIEACKGAMMTIDSPSAAKYLARSGIMKRERSKLPRESLDLLVNLSFERLIEDVLAPTMTVDSRLFDLFSVAFIRPEPKRINRYTRYNPNSLSIVNPNTGRSTMAINIQRAGFGIHSDKQTAAGALGYASTEGASKGVLENFRGYVVLDEIQDYNLNVLSHMLNVMELGEAGVVQAATGFRIRCDGTFIGLANTPPGLESSMDMQMTLLKLLSKLTTNPYGLPRRLPIFLFGNDFRTVQPKPHPLNWREHDKALVLISEYVRFFQREINKIYEQTKAQEFLNRRLPKDYIEQINAIADNIENTSPLVSIFVREQENGSPKINGYALRLAIRDSLEKFKSERVDQLVESILNLAEIKRGQILSDNLRGFGKFASGIDIALKELIYDEKAIEQLPEFHQDFVRLLQKESRGQVSVDELIEDRYNSSICKKPKKHLRYYFLRNTSVQSINAKLRAFGWEVIEIEGKRVLFKHH